MCSGKPRRTGDGRTVKATLRHPCWNLLTVGPLQTFLLVQSGLTLVDGKLLEISISAISGTTNPRNSSNNTPIPYNLTRLFAFRLFLSHCMTRIFIINVCWQRAR